MQLLVLVCKLLRLVLFHVPFAFDSMNDFHPLHLTLFVTLDIKFTS
jgi:hypothetical protein